MLCVIYSEHKATIKTGPPSWILKHNRPPQGVPRSARSTSARFCHRSWRGTGSPLRQKNFRFPPLACADECPARREQDRPCGSARAARRRLLWLVERRASYGKFGSRCSKNAARPSAAASVVRAVALTAAPAVRSVFKSSPIVSLSIRLVSKIASGAHAAISPAN